MSKFEVKGKITLTGEASGFELTYKVREGDNHFLIEYSKGSDQIRVKTPEGNDHMYSILDELEDGTLSYKIFLNERTMPFLLQAARNENLK